jgi:hypothetical protein
MKPATQTKLNPHLVNSSLQSSMQRAICFCDAISSLGFSTATL